MRRGSVAQNLVFFGHQESSILRGNIVDADVDDIVGNDALGIAVSGVNKVSGICGSHSSSSSSHGC